MRNPSHPIAQSSSISSFHTRGGHPFCLDGGGRAASIISQHAMFLACFNARKILKSRTHHGKGGDGRGKEGRLQIAPKGGGGKQCSIIASLSLSLSLSLSRHFCRKCSHKMSGSHLQKLKGRRPDEASRAGMRLRLCESAQKQTKMRQYGLRRRDRYREGRKQ